jgi:indolepyruvate ferredoxin oxidoreductase
MNDSAVDLRDRLVSDTGRHFMPGMQALMRLPLEQARRDHAGGLRTGTLITGYPGSPIAGLDLQLAREPALLKSHDIRHIPAGNEEQAVTALTGSQMLDSYPHERFDGVVGFWYGKGPGLDRAGDALRHGNFAGTSSHGAVVVLSGEDHEAKSSTMPFQQEYAFASAGIPILYPGSIADIRRLGLHAVEMSRFSGCWVALKLVSQVCDGGETLDLGEPVPFRVPELEIEGHRFEKRTDFTFYPGKNIEHERQLYAERHRAALAYARANGLNRFDPPVAGARVGIVSAGKSAVEVRQALADHGIPSDALAERGIRILDLGLIYPLDTELVREFAADLDRIIVVEEKRDWLETAIKAAIQPLGRAIEVVGKYDASAQALFPGHGGMDADIIGECLARVLPVEISRHDPAGRQRQLAAIRSRNYTVAVTRAPNFCSGCPHNTSTRLADGQLAWGAPGCGAFNSVMEQPHRRIESMSQFGGEGAGWVGLAPFTERPHLTHNVGDGAMYHSSYLNVRWAAAVGTNITFKVLYNGAVANTGAQLAVGSRGVPDLVRGLSTEGVQRIVVITKTPEKYDGQDLGSITSVRPAADLHDASRELERTPGVTVLLYDETCANERRRQQKRGQIEKPTEHLFINEAVCEGCGDCGAKSNCMSLQRVDTEFGPKTQIHSSSCNDDYSCLEGDCPSFVTVKVAPGTGFRKPAYPKIDTTRLPRPAGQRPTEPYHIYMPGVGGTGVITINAILAVATQIDGMKALTYDQTGAAQKWGSVLSSLVIVPPDSPPISNKVGLGRADVMIALDDVTAAAAVNLDRCDPGRTALVHNTDLFATGEMVRDVDVSIDRSAITSLLHTWTTDENRVEVPARHLAESCFGDYMLANVIALGAAVQAGLVPVSVEALEQAIRLNGVAVAANLAALAVGRQWVVDPAGLSSDDDTHRNAREEVEFRAARIGPKDAQRYRALVGRTAGLDAEIQRLLAVRVAELIEYQPGPLVARYLDRVLAIDRYEQQFPGAEGALTAAVARNLFRLLAYKDEYEVARMYLDRDFDDAIRQRFESPLRVEYNLHPPVLRRFGRERKITVGPWIRGPFRVLKAARRVRGTPFDPFGWQATRREERELITWYDELLDRMLGGIAPATMPILVELAELPSTIRGYEQVKSRNAAKARRRSDELLRRLDQPDMTIVVHDAV